MSRRCTHQLIYLYREPKDETLRLVWLLRRYDAYARCTLCGRVAVMGRRRYRWLAPEWTAYHTGPAQRWEAEVEARDGQEAQPAEPAR